MSRLAITCTACRKQLLGGTDTFGDVNCPFCWNCYSSLQGESGESIYGLGPHHHDLTITGHMIGSTVFDPLPEPNADGEYEIDDMIFWPDPEALGLGVWTYKVIPGWR